MAKARGREFGRAVEPPPSGVVGQGHGPRSEARCWVQSLPTRGGLMKDSDYGRGYSYGGPAVPGGLVVGIGLGILLDDFFAWLLIATLAR
jgi:hypothetical protein